MGRYDTLPVGADPNDVLRHALGGPQPRASVSLASTVRWKLSDLALGLVVLLAWRFVELTQPTWLDGHSPWLRFLAGVGFPALWMLLFPLLAARARGRPSIISDITLVRLWREGIVAVPFTVVTLVGLAGLSMAAVALTGEMLGTAKETAMRDDVLALMLLSITIAPVAEELFFRGLVQNCLRKHWGVSTALLAQAALFALMHHYAPMRMLAVFILGLALGMLYEWRQTLLTPVLVHGLLNLAAGVATLLVLLVNTATPFLGVQGTPDPAGYRIESIVAESPADLAGLRPGDVITHIDAQSVDEVAGVTPLLRTRRIGDEIVVTLERKGQPRRAKVTLGKRPIDP